MIGIISSAIKASRSKIGQETQRVLEQATALKKAYKKGEVKKDVYDRQMRRLDANLQALSNMSKK